MQEKVTILLTSLVLILIACSKDKTSNPTTSLPLAPTNLVGTALTDTSIQLTWTDNSTNETGFSIHRCITGGASYEEVDTTLANAVTFADNRLWTDTSYAYYVTAVNVLGHSSHSNTVITRTASGIGQIDSVGQCDTPGDPAGICIKNNYVYIADTYSGLTILDISSPTAPYSVSNLQLPDGTYDVTVAGGYAYASSGYGCLQIINISDPAHPTIAGAWDTTASISFGSIALNNNYIFMTSHSYGLQVFNISNPQAPTHVGGNSLSLTNANAIAISGNYAYVTDLENGNYEGLKVFDISNLTNPVLISNLGRGSSCRAICINGNYAYVTKDASGLLILDISNPTSPTSIGYCHFLNTVLSVFVDGTNGLAYLAAGASGLIVVDISNPTHPHWAGNYAITGHFGNSAAYDVAEAGGYCYLADRDSGIIVFRFTR